MNCVQRFFYIHSNWLTPSGKDELSCICLVYFEYTRCLHVRDLDVRNLRGMCVDVDVDELNGFAFSGSANRCFLDAGQEDFPFPLCC